MPETNFNEFEARLQNLVAVPSARPDFVDSLWERMVERSNNRRFIVAKPNRSWSNAFASRQPSFQGDHRRLFLFAALILTILTGIFLVTPAGQVVAEQIVAFFVHAERNEKPIVYPTTAPTQTLASLPTAKIENPSLTTSVPGAILPTTTDTPGKSSQPEAGVPIGYSVKEPQYLPLGYRFSYAKYFPETRNMLLVYAYTLQAKGEMIMLTLSPTLIQEEIGPNAQVVPTMISGHPGNMVQGGWIALSGEYHQSWESRLPVTTMRWFDGETYIKLQFHQNEPTSPAALSRSQMLKVAESIQVVDPGKSGLNYSELGQDFQKMEEQLGVHLFVPGILPEGYQLTTVEKVPGRQQVYAQYRPATSGESGPRLSISQIPRAGLPEITPQRYPPDLVTLVDISGRQGRLIAGVNDGGSFPSWWLFWETPDLALSIWFYPGPQMSETEAKAWMVQIAKSMQ